MPTVRKFFFTCSLPRSPICFATEDGISDWWTKRTAQTLKLVDMLRLDHFRGFIASWQVSASNKTAKKGHWVRAPSDRFFALVANHFPNLPLIAEDPGNITAKVEKTLAKLRIPGMRVLLFAFGDSKNNPHLPINYGKNSVVFTGTHDTNTVRGWFIEEAILEQKNSLFKVIGKHVDEDEVGWELIKLAQESKANLSIVPAQDVLGLGSEARMYCPAESAHNWEWQLTPEQFSSENFQRLDEISENSCI